MWITIVTAHDLFGDGKLLLYEGKNNFLKITHISERLCPVQLLHVDDNVLWGSFYLKKSMLPKIVVKSFLRVNRGKMFDCNANIEFCKGKYVWHQTSRHLFFFRAVVVTVAHWIFLMCTELRILIPFYSLLCICTSFKSQELSLAVISPFETIPFSNLPFVKDSFVKDFCRWHSRIKS